MSKIVAPFNLDDDVLFRAFRSEFESEIRKHLESVVLQISKPIVDKAIRGVVDHMTLALRENWQTMNTEFCVLIRDERNLKRD